MLFPSRLAVLDLILESLDLTKPRKRVFALLFEPSLLSHNQIPPQPHLLLMQGNSVTPTGFDGVLVGLWFGEFIAAMRDRTLDEGNDVGQAYLREMVAYARTVKGNLFYQGRQQRIPQFVRSRCRELHCCKPLCVVFDEPRMIDQSLENQRFSGRQRRQPAGKPTP